MKWMQTLLHVDFNSPAREPCDFIALYSRDGSGEHRGAGSVAPDLIVYFIPLKVASYLVEPKGNRFNENSTSVRSSKPKAMAHPLT